MSKKVKEMKDDSAIITNRIVEIDERIEELEELYTQEKELREIKLTGLNKQLKTLQEIAINQAPDPHIVQVQDGYAQISDKGNRAPSPLNLEIDINILDTKEEIQQLREKAKTDDKHHEEMLKKLRKQKSEKESELEYLIKTAVKTAGGRKTRRRRNLSSRERRTRRSRKSRRTRRK